MGGRKRDLTTKEAKPFPYPNTIDQSLRTETLKERMEVFRIRSIEVTERTLQKGSRGLRMDDQLEFEWYQT